MINIKKLLGFGLSLLLLSSSTVSCARNASQKPQDRVLQFTFRVKGKMILNRNDVTYYLVIYAPKSDNPDTALDPNVGPRINAPNITRGAEFLEGRLPFIGQLPGDQESKWTDFYYITFENNKTTVGRGRLRDGEPEIYDRNYANQNTKALQGANGNINGYQIELNIKDLNEGDSNTNSIIANLASSDNINIGGSGMVFDSWRGNIPFSISLNTETQQSQQDIDPNLVMRTIPNRPAPSLPSGVNPDDVNIIEYSARVTK